MRVFGTDIDFHNKKLARVKDTELPKTRYLRQTNNRSWRMKDSKNLIRHSDEHGKYQIHSKISIKNLKTTAGILSILEEEGALVS